MLERVGQYVLVLIAAVSLNFFLPRAMPGSPLQFLAGEDVALSGRERASAVLSYWLAGWPVGRIARRMGCARSVVLELLSRYAMPGPGWDAPGTGCNDDEEVVV